MEAILGLACPAAGIGGLLLLGLFVGRAVERSHLEDLARREAQHRGFFVTQVGSFPGAVLAECPPRLVTAEVVMATDYLRRFLASVRKLLGGEIRGYQTLLERARREALLRLVEQARAEGYNALCNVRLEWADIGGNVQGEGTVMAPLLASATAYWCDPHELQAARRDALCFHAHSP